MTASNRLYSRVLFPSILCTLLLGWGSGCAASKNDKATLVQADTFHQSLTPAVLKQPPLDQYYQAIGARIVAAAMSHEFAHSYCRHVQKGMNTQKWVMAGSVAAGGAGYVAGGEESGADYA